MRAGKVTDVKSVLFWTWRPPVMVFRATNDTLVNCVLVLMAKVPPTEVKFGALMEEKELS